MVVGLMRHIRNFPLVSSHEKVQGPNSQPGYRHILTLAKVLVEVWSLQGLPDNRMDRLITLWQRLPEGDKQRVVYPARHQERQTKGRSKEEHLLGRRVSNGSQGDRGGGEGRSGASSLLQPSPANPYLLQQGCPRFRWDKDKGQPLITSLKRGQVLPPSLLSWLNPIRLCRLLLPYRGPQPTGRGRWLQERSLHPGPDPSGRPAERLAS
ncbi:uncharacterized protein LOC121640522 isoform X2 [Melanotaenia boesemani]|uniref:uncharacterized protein LOC121640522 isoform X2 n=1 Tax=Melanotaenia boesemani TaxID=1250792 RepID=UPI001C057CCF|nr:uncharacterized protein LOC121640522 isoform X2 [Melanotaenia boesemani]